MLVAPDKAIPTFTAAAGAMFDDWKLAAALVGVASGVVTFVCAHWLFSLYETRQLRVRLRRVLIFECAATINKMSRIESQIAESRTCDSDEEVTKVRHLFSGFVVSGPHDQARTLMELVGPNESSLVGYFFDRWDRFRGLERRYAAAHKRLLESVAKVKASADDAAFFAIVKDEYWSQTCDELDSLERCAQDLCYISCRLFRCEFNAARLGQNFAQIRDHSNGRWKSWEDFVIDEARYKQIWVANRA